MADLRAAGADDRRAYDHYETYGEHWSPRAYLVYNATDTVTVKGGWATAFKAPSLLQLSPDWTSNSCRGACKISWVAAFETRNQRKLELGLYYMGEEGWLGRGSIQRYRFP